MFDASQLGQQLRRVRERVGLSQEAVAKELDLPRAAVTYMENGKRAVSTLALSQLAELYGCSELSLLPSDKPTSAEPLHGALLRAIPELRKAPALGGSVRRLLSLYRDGVALRGSLGQASPPGGIPDHAATMESEDDAILQGENAAQQERQRLSLGNVPIRNIAKVISDQGIWTVAILLPKRLSGLFVNHSDVGMAILVNQGYRHSRRRFSYAHEYAHALFDRQETVKTTRSDNSTKLAEVRANSFAAAFLMPSAGVAEQLAHRHKGLRGWSSRIVYDVAGDRTTEKEARSSPTARAIAFHDVAHLARHYGVSYEEVAWRLQQLNYIRAAERRVLMNHRKIGTELINLIAPQLLDDEGVAQSDSWERELRGQLLVLAIEAVRREKISMGRYLEICRKLSEDEELMLELAHVAGTC